jgi:hypothetical protein
LFRQNVFHPGNLVEVVPHVIVVQQLGAHALALLLLLFHRDKVGNQLLRRGRAREEGAAHFQQQHHPDTAVFRVGVLHQD